MSFVRPYGALTAAEVSHPDFKFSPGRGLSTESELQSAITSARAGNAAQLAALVNSRGITMSQVPIDLIGMVNQYNAWRGGRRRKTRHRKSRRRHGRKTRRSRK